MNTFKVLGSLSLSKFDGYVYLPMTSVHLILCVSYNFLVILSLLNCVAGWGNIKQAFASVFEYNEHGM